MINTTLATPLGVTSTVLASAIVTALISILKPLIETIPAFSPTSAAHDAVLRALNLLVNMGAQFLIAAMMHPLGASDILPAIAVGFLQAGGSEGFYQLVTGSGQSVNQPAGPVVAAPSTPPPAPPPPAA